MERYMGIQSMLASFFTLKMVLLWTWANGVEDSLIQEDHVRFRVPSIFGKIVRSSDFTFIIMAYFMREQSIRLQDWVRRHSI